MIAPGGGAALNAAQGVTHWMLKSKGRTPTKPDSAASVRRG